MLRYKKDNFILINGRDIELTEEVNEDTFWISKNYDEEDYLKLLKESQDFFYNFLTEAPDIERFYTSTGYQQLMIWIADSNCVKVSKKGSKYFCIFNGRHRCAVAKKYGLDILAVLW